MADETSGARTFPDPSKMNYEEAVAALEKIIAEIEAGTIGLEDSIAAYRHGTALIKHCRAILEKAEREIELVEEKAGGGQSA